MFASHQISVVTNAYKSINQTAQKRRYWVPSSLRFSAASYLQRVGSRCPRARDRSARSVPCNRAKRLPCARLPSTFEIQDFTIRAQILNFTSSKIEQIFKISPQARPRNYVYLNDGMDFPSFSALNGCHHIRVVRRLVQEKHSPMMLNKAPTLRIIINSHFESCTSLSRAPSFLRQASSETYRPRPYFLLRVLN